MAIDMTALEERELFHGGGVTVDHAGIVHEFGKADARGVAHQRRNIGGQQFGPGGFHMGGGHAGAELDADVHHGALRGGLKIADALGPDHVGNLVRIADRRGDAARRDAAVEFERRHERRFRCADACR